MMYKTIKIKKIFCALIILSTVTFWSCGSSQEVTSSWQNGTIHVNGDISDWTNNIQQVPDKNFSVGFKNDDKFLYVALSTSDRSKIFQMFHSGFIVWFEPENSESKTIGIKYPIADSREGEMRLPEQGKEGMTRNEMKENGRPKENPAQMFDKILITQTELEIINKDKYPLLALPLINNDGIEAKLGFKEDQFIYELKIPLASQKQYSINAGALPGEKIKITFETEKTETQKGLGDGSRMRMGGRGEEPTGTEGGMTSGNEPGGRRRPGGKMGERSEPLNYTFNVSLVKSEAGK